MKRAALTLLALYLIAMPSFAGTTTGHKLTGARCLSLEHVAGGWRMDIRCDQNKGSILLLDAGRHAQYVGEGIFRDWSQSELMTVYQSLIPRVDSNFEVMQLG